MTEKIGISMNSDLLSRIDAYAEDNYISRSGLISMACNQYLNAMELQSCLNRLTLAVERVAENTAIDEQSKRDIEDFERVARLIVGNSAR